MTTWYSKELGDGVDALDPSSQIKAAHFATVLAHGETRGAAVFSRYDSEANVVTVYFTPQAQALAQQFGAAPCEKPHLRAGLKLLAGSPLDRALHFPD